MKQVLSYWPYLLALGGGILAGHYWASGQKEAEAQKQILVIESNWEAEKARLEEALLAERNKPPKIQTVYREVPAAFTNKMTPREILDRLIELKPTEYETRNQTFRKIIFYMQSLVEAGPYGFPVISDFLAQNVDVDYSQFDVTPAGERVSRVGRSGFASRSLVRTDFLVPPSLRLGLLDVLGQVGGAEAEQILAEMLLTTARGVEVAYLARVLHDLRPDYYRDMALQAARELLASPPEFENPNRLDENSKAYLYEVLGMYNDTSFAQTAQGLIVTPDGRVDRHALDYVNEVLKEYAVPAILQAYNDPRLTSSRERSSLLNVALEYTGPNAQANQIFFQMLTNQTVSSGVRAFSVQSLSGNSQHEAPTDPYVIRSRIDFLEAIRPSIADERVLRSVDAARQELERLLSSPPSGS